MTRLLVPALLLVAAGSTGWLLYDAIGAQIAVNV